MLTDNVVVVQAPQIPYTCQLTYAIEVWCTDIHVDVVLVYMAEILHAMQLTHAIKLCQLDIGSCTNAT